jgi:hypothetical protein
MVTCDKCGRETGQRYAECTRCGGTFCIEHRSPEDHGCVPARTDGPAREQAERIDRDQDWYNPSSGARPFSNAGRSQAKTGTLTSAENVQAILEIISFFVGLLMIAGGIYLFFGNTTGLHPTFPFAGFITMSVGGIFVYFALSTR